MKNTLSEMWYKYKLLSWFKRSMNDLGWVGKDLYVLDVQLGLLKELIEIESMNILNDLLQKKTYMRLLKSIIKGVEHLPSIIEYPEEFVLNPIEKDVNAWISQDVLIFECRNVIAVFSKKTRKNDGALYIDGKWQ